MTITVRRDPAQGPNPKGFVLTTNGNGTETKFDGKVQLRDAAGVPTYTVEFWAASMQAYSTAVTADLAAPGVEEWVFVAPKFKVSGAGATAEFDSRESRHKVGG